MTDELPEGWAASTLGGLVRPSKRKMEPGNANGQKYIGLEHIESDTNRIVGTDDAGGVKSTMVAFRPGDVLYSKLRPYLNKVAIAPFAGVGSTEILVFEQVPYLNAKYLMLFLSRRTTVQTANERANGVQLPRITFDKIADLDFPLPPLAEQLRIVAKVEELLAEVNHAKARLTKAQAILQRFRRSALAAACSGELTREWRESHPEVRQEFEPRLLEKPARQGRRGANLSGGGALLIDDEMADLPATWKYARADQLVEHGTVVTYGIVLPGQEVEGGIPYVRGQDVEDGWLRTDALRHTTVEIASKHKRSALRQGDVLLCIIRNLRVAIVPAGIDGANITQGMVRFRANASVVLPEFLAAYLASPQAQQWMKRRYFGMDMPRINVEDARAIPVALPPPQEQTEIMRLVGACLSWAEVAERRATAAMERVGRLPQAILSQAFSGDLVPTEAELAGLEGRDYEPASELLERVKSEAASRVLPKTEVRSRKRVRVAV